MQTTYAQKNETVQKASANTADSVVDSSSQSATLQRHASLANAAVQRAENPPRPNNTGLPDDLKNGIESLSGYSLDNVRVHYNSPKPATVQALAYTQGTDIHVAPGQEHALPHEAWHVTQQMAGRVSPTTNINGMPVNDNATLEHEADVMGEKAVQCKMPKNGETIQCKGSESSIVQRHKGGKGEIAINPALLNTGANPYTMDQKYKGFATFHHIYPKSWLVKYVSTIEKAYLNHLDYCEGDTGAKKMFTSLRNNVTNNGISANLFYWSAGTGFVGYRPEDRADDPHDSPEEKRPQNMDSEVFEKAKGARIDALEKVCNEINNGKITYKTASDCLTIEKDLRKKQLYYTDPYCFYSKKKKNTSKDWTTLSNERLGSYLGDEVDPSNNFKLK